MTQSYRVRKDSQLHYFWRCVGIAFFALFYNFTKTNKEETKGMKKAMNKEELRDVLEMFLAYTLYRNIKEQ